MVTKSPKAHPARPDQPSEAPLSALDRWFEITARGSSVAREVRGGLVTFFAMAYILALNPLILGTTTDRYGLLISGKQMFLDDAMTKVDAAAVNEAIAMVAAATALVAGVLTILMGLWARFPIGLAAGLGLNALVAHVIVPQMTWAQAMGLIVWEGVIISILVLTGFREAVFKAVPRAIRTSISVGIGLFIAFVGLIDAGVVRKPAGAPPVELGVGGSLIGWPILVFVLGFFLLIGLHVLRVKGAMLISIVASTLIAVLIETVFHVGPNTGEANPTGWALNVPKLPDLAAFTAPNLGLLGKVDLFGAFYVEGQFSPKVALGLVLVIFSLLLADFFDTMGTIVAVGSAGKMLDAEHNPPHLREILLVDSLAAIAGGAGSVSSNTSYIESSAGVGDGARTGLASVVTGCAFLLAIFIAPVVNMVPSEAAAPVLVIVGFLMIQQVTDVDWEDPSHGIPAFLTLILMPFTYSITVGIGVGFIAYVFIKLLQRKASSVHPLMYVIVGLFLVYFVQGALVDLFL